MPPANSSPVSAGRKCIFCGGSDLAVCDHFAGLTRVTSDCRPWPAGGSLAQCRSCHLVQSLVDASWRAEVGRIYAGYAIYHEADGAEQQVFVQGDGRPSSRSDVIADRLLARGILPARGALLDVGCGNGALLRAFSRRLGGWTLSGAELNATHEQAVRSIRGVKDFITDPIEALTGQYDLVSLVHVLEHLPDLGDAIPRLAALLKPGGWLLIEVPNCLVNPFMLLVADHCSHHSPAVLASLWTRSGFRVAEVSDQWIPKEITLLAQKSAVTPGTADESVCGAEAERILAHVSWLNALVERVSAIQGRPQFGLFGTSVAATWLDAQTGGRARFFVDEDPARQGRQHFQRPVLAPKDIPMGATVFIAVPHHLAGRIAARLAVPGVDWIIPDP
jgi:SAM-dependent methyltransferase